MELLVYYTIKNPDKDGNDVLIFPAKNQKVIIIERDDYQNFQKRETSPTIRVIDEL